VLVNLEVRRKKFRIYRCHPVIFGFPAIAGIAADNVADPGCSSRIPDPDFYPSRIPDLGSRIPDPKTATKDRGEKFFFVKLFFVATNFTKLNIILFLIFLNTGC
jgi:hypothetical protein